MSDMWVLGARGQVGHHLCALLGTRARGFTSTELDFTSPDFAEILEAVLAKDTPKIVINMAAYTDVAGAENDEARAMQVNAHAVRMLAEALSTRQIPLIHGSTDYVFNGRKDEPYAEDDKTAPLNAYGRSKRAGEEAVLAYKHGYVLRYSWVYDSAGKNFFTTMKALMAKAESLRIVADQIGAPSYAQDLARATMMFADDLPKPGIYHMSAGGYTSWHGFADAIAETLKLANQPVVTKTIEPISTEEYGGPVARPLCSRLDTAKLTALGIEMPHWRDGLARCVAAMVATKS